ncbi:hypothetical protein C8R44DRAFT_892125 [Mycena epipterygia]|nr:hypothetical protein C8R44DRAFT_892125 [Mycena epipterygia]
MNSDDDADLARVIPLSMQEEERAKAMGRAHTHAFTVARDGDEDEDDIGKVVRPVTTRKQVNGNSTSEAHKDDAKPAPPLKAEEMEH